LSAGRTAETVELKGILFAAAAGLGVVPVPIFVSWIADPAGKIA
jgi:hypothetical protein